MRICRIAATGALVGWGVMASTSCDGGSTIVHRVDGGDGAADVNRCKLSVDAACPQLVLAKIGADRVAVDGDTIYLRDGYQILRTAKAGAGLERFADTVGLPNKIRPRGSFVYWSTFSAPQKTTGGVYRMPKSGGSPVALASNLENSPLFAIEEPFLYYTATNGRIVRVPLEPLDAGQAPEPLVESGSPVFWFDLDKDYFYFGQFIGTLELSRVTITGGLIEHVHSEARLDGGANYIPAPVFSEDFIYWFSPDRGDLQRVAKSGGDAELVYHRDVSGHGTFNFLVIAKRYAYIFDWNKSLYRVALDSHVGETLVRDVDILDLYTDDEAVYFAVPEDGIYRIRH